MFGLSPMELVIVGVVAILLFGKRLPDVAKSLGKSYKEFRSGLNELQSQVNINDAIYNTPSYSSSSRSSSTKSYDDYDEPTAPKFEPPPAPADSPASAAIAVPSETINHPIGEK